MNNFILYLFGTFSLLISIETLSKGHILSGIIFLILAIILYPLTLNYFNSRFKLNFSGISKQIVLFLLLIFGFVFIGRDMIAEKRIKNLQADKLLEQADSLIRVRQIDLAAKNIREAKLLYDKPNEQKAQSFEDDLLLYQSENYLKESFLKMSDEDYNKLIKSSLAKIYIYHACLNDLFLEKLFNNKEIGVKIIEEKREQERMAALEAENHKMYLRMFYAPDLRNTFLDNGLDIKVKVSGKNFDRLTLTFVLFNDVWTRKFTTDGSFAIWAAMGFKRIDITNGYDYHIYYNLK